MNADHKFPSLTRHLDEAANDPARLRFLNEEIDRTQQLISAERKNDLKLHVRVANLNKFKHVSTDYPVSRHYQHGDSNQPGRIVGSAPTVENVDAKADMVGTNQISLRAYIAQDQAAQAK